MLAEKEIIEPNRIVSYRPILKSASQPTKGASSKETICDIPKNCEFTCRITNPLVWSRPEEKENNPCHTSSNSILLLQQLLGDLLHQWLWPERCDTVGWAMCSGDWIIGCINTALICTSNTVWKVVEQINFLVTTQLSYQTFFNAAQSNQQYYINRTGN